uniref:ADP-ribose glycohydrolase MACROD1-like isoform X2 n=1 Tax=Myxine glutinosa TaxID=7769 RepID=UPI00358F2C32
MLAALARRLAPLRSFGKPRRGEALSRVKSSASTTSERSSPSSSSPASRSPLRAADRRPRRAAAPPGKSALFACLGVRRRGMAANQSKVDWTSWERAKEQLLSIPADRRKYYRCGENYLSLDEIKKWSTEQDSCESNKQVDRKCETKKALNEKISLFKGDITLLEVDAIVNAANSSLLGGGGVDGCIHRAAGSLLKDECRTLDGCPTGQAKMTCGYRLPARYVIHTVGPRVLSTDPTNEERSKLESCYNDSLSILLQENLRSVAFPCISTGVFGFPNEPAAEIALHSVRTWLEKHHEKVDRIILCLFLPVDEKIYKDLLPVYFPHPPKDDDVDSAEERREACSSDVEMESQDLQESEQPTDKEEPSPIDSESGPMSEKMMNGAEESQQDKTADAHQESSVDEIGGGEGGAKLKTDEK